MKTETMVEKYAGGFLMIDIFVSFFSLVHTMLLLVTLSFIRPAKVISATLTSYSREPFAPFLGKYSRSIVLVPLLLLSSGGKCCIIMIV
jgi:hypothetical protein